MNKLGIIGAMTMEVETLVSSMESAVSKEIAGSTFYEGMLEGLPAVIVQCGVGKVNAALCAQILCTAFGVTHLVNTGIAGSLDASLEIGEIVISSDVMYHDVQVGTIGNYPRGQVPGMDVRAFPVDRTLGALAARMCSEQGIAYRTGRIVSGDQFICDSEIKAEIARQCGGLCVEMEGAAIAHAAYRNRLPALVLRAISDKADDSAAMDYPTFEALAAERCAGLTMALAESLAKETDVL